MIRIREIEEKDKDAIWEILEFVISQGDSFTFALETSRDFALGDWCSSEKHSFVAVDDDKILGTFYIKPNQTGLGSHVANAGYAVSHDVRRMGVGRLMGENSLVIAKDLGYLAMQFNIVVKSNIGAVNLWKSLGFQIIGEIPEAFLHKENGLTNAYIMYKKL
ncbi:MAG: N-acetyltransferase [Pyrinomonadaceae bacterium]